MRLRASLLGLCLVAVATDALAAGPYAFVTGRRDPRIYAIDLGAALKPANNNTGNAIISRNWVGPKRLDGVLHADVVGRTFEMNVGPATALEAITSGERGLV